MSSIIRVTGPTRLQGSMRMSGSKNGCLLVLAGCLLGKGKVTLSNVPQLADVASMVELLRELGVNITTDGMGKMELDASTLNKVEASYEIVRKMRASIAVLGPLMARKRRARVALPGGCAIGDRPINIHIDALKALGARSTLDGGDLYLEADELKGADIHFKGVSMGATANAITAATLAQGRTRLYNASIEPELRDLCHFLVECYGADIQIHPDSSQGAQYTITGKESLSASNKESLSASGKGYEIAPDRIETGTYAIAVAATGGKVELTHTRPEDLDLLWETLKQSGAKVEIDKHKVMVEANKPLNPLSISTAPYPEFPTDLQAQWTALAIKGESNARKITITERVFPHRFIHISELQRMGANIELNKNSAIVTPVAKLSAASVMATDLRASVALVIAALGAEGTSTISRIYHLKRGYENLTSKLSTLGANITEEME